VSEVHEKAMDGVKAYSAPNTWALCCHDRVVFYL
jgi:hypothetical protein